MNTERQSGYVLLLVEDSLADVHLIEQLISNVRPTIDLQVVRDGEAATNYLRKVGEYATKPTPDLILLDLNLPRKNGLEVLRDIKADPQLQHIPTIILTTSDAPRDISAAYAARANSYIIKPSDLDQFILLIQTLDRYWFDLVELPLHNQD
jgi:CheY-like chemotaxis protein